MNCNCNKPAVVRTVSKPGPNNGKQFFSCNNNGDCNFFCWVGASQPINVRQKIQNPQSLQLQGNNKSCTVRLALHEFEESPSRRIWFSSMSCYDAMLTKFFLSIPEHRRKYVDNIKLWVFDFDIYEVFVSNLKSDDFDFVNLIELPRFLSIGLRKYLNSLIQEPNMNENISLTLEPTITEYLLPFQIEGVKFVIRHGGKAMIADEMGCGKTIQAIALIQHYRNQWPVLILVPPQLLKQWYEELRKFAGDLLVEKDVCVIRKSSDNPRGKICIIPYSLLDKLVEQDKISPQRFGMVVCDESHNIKNKTAKRTSMAIPFMRAAAVCLCLSGTPATNRPEELFTQLSGIRPEIFGDSDYRDFTIRYCDAKDGRFGWETKGSSNEVELKLLLEGCIMIRRKKADVIFNLPTKDRIVRYVTADPHHLEEIKIKQTQARELESAIRDAAGGDISVLKGLRQQQQVLLNAQWMITGMSKIEGVLSELRALIDEARTERVISEQLDDAKKAEAAAAIVELDEDKAVLIDLLHEEEYDSDGSQKYRNDGGEMGWGRGQKISGNGNILEEDNNCINLIEVNEDVDIRELSSNFLPNQSNAFNEGSTSIYSPCKAKEVTYTELPIASGNSKISSTSKVAGNQDIIIVQKKDDEDDLTDSDIDDTLILDNNKVNKRLVRLSHQSPNKRKHNDDDDELADSDDDNGGGGGGGGGGGAKSDHCKVNKRLIRLSHQSPNKSPGKKQKCHDSDELEFRLFDDVDYASTISNSNTLLNGNFVINDDDDEGMTEDIFFLDQPVGISRYGLRSQSKSKGKNQNNNNNNDHSMTITSNQYYSKEISVESNEHLDEMDAVDIWRKLLPGDTSIDILPSNIKSKQKKKNSKISTSKPTIMPTPISYRGLGRKIIVFAHHASVFDALELCLRQLDVTFIRIDGKVAAASRGDLIRRFQEDDETDVALLSLTACGTGLNLTRANVAVFAELTWSPGLVEQAEARIHRIGQSSSSIKVIYILAKGTADDIVWEQLQKKHTILGATLGISRDTQHQPGQDSLKTSVTTTIPVTPFPSLNDKIPTKANDKDKNKDLSGSSSSDNSNILTLDNYFSPIPSSPPPPPQQQLSVSVSNHMSDLSTGATTMSESKRNETDSFLNKSVTTTTSFPPTIINKSVTSNGIIVDNQYQVNGSSINNTTSTTTSTSTSSSSSKVMPVCPALPSWVPRSRPMSTGTAHLTASASTSCTTNFSNDDGSSHHNSISFYSVPDSELHNISRTAHEYYNPALTNNDCAIRTSTAVASYPSAPIASDPYGYSKHHQPPHFPLPLPQSGSGGSTCHQSHSTNDFDYSPSSTCSTTYMTPYPETNGNSTQQHVAKYENIPLNLSSNNTVTNNTNTTVASISSSLKVSDCNNGLTIAPSVVIMPGKTSFSDTSDEAAATKRRIEENKRRAQEILQRKKAEKGARDVLDLMDSLQSEKVHIIFHSKSAETTILQQSPQTTSTSMLPNGYSYSEFPRQSFSSCTEGSTLTFSTTDIPSGNVTGGIPSHTTSVDFSNFGIPNSTISNMSASSNGHVFSTGRGSKLSVTNEAIVKAEGILSEVSPRNSHTASTTTTTCASERRQFTGAINYHPVLQSQSPKASLAAVSALNQNTIYEQSNRSYPLPFLASSYSVQPTNASLVVNATVSSSEKAETHVPVFDNKSSNSYGVSSLKPLVRSVD